MKIDKGIQNNIMTDCNARSQVVEKVNIKSNIKDHIICQILDYSR